jgi:hypothetical protein
VLLSLPRKVLQPLDAHPQRAPLTVPACFTCEHDRTRNQKRGSSSSLRSGCIACRMESWWWTSTHVLPCVYLRTQPEPTQQPAAGEGEANGETAAVVEGEGAKQTAKGRRSLTVRETASSQVGDSCAVAVEGRAARVRRSDPTELMVRTISCRGRIDAEGESVGEDDAEMRREARRADTGWLPSRSRRESGRSRPLSVGGGGGGGALLRPPQRSRLLRCY